MPKDLSPELDLTLWGAWFFDEMHKIPHTRDTWASHCADALQTYTMGGEL